MTIAELCLPAAILLIIATIGPAKMIGRRDYDNSNPRDPRFYTPGFRARSQGAHLNGYESFPFFAAAVLLAEFKTAPQGMIDALAIGFLLARLGYVACYLGDKPTLRSVIWAVALAFNLGIFFLPAFART